MSLSTPISAVWIFRTPPVSLRSPLSPTSLYSASSSIGQLLEVMLQTSGVTPSRTIQNCSSCARNMIGRGSTSPKIRTEKRRPRRIYDFFHSRCISQVSRTHLGHHLSHTFLNSRKKPIMCLKNVPAVPSLPRWSRCGSSFSSPPTALTSSRFPIKLSCFQPMCRLGLV